MTTRAGVTLVELLIVLALLALLSSVAILAPRPDPPLDANERLLGDSLRVTSGDGRARIVQRDSSSAWVLPDGRIIADSAFHVDPLTGRIRHAR